MIDIVIKAGMLYSCYQSVVDRCVSTECHMTYYCMYRGPDIKPPQIPLRGNKLGKGPDFFRYSCHCLFKDERRAMVLERISSPLYVKVLIGPLKQGLDLLTNIAGERPASPLSSTDKRRSSFLGSHPGHIDDWRVVASSTRI